jgi:hypothetical protein
VQSIHCDIPTCVVDFPSDVKDTLHRKWEVNGGLGGGGYGGLKVITPLIRLQEAPSSLWEINSFPHSFSFSLLPFSLVHSLYTSLRLSLTDIYIHGSVTDENLNSKSYRCTIFIS